MTHRALATLCLVCTSIFATSSAAQTRLEPDRLDPATGLTEPLSGWRFRSGDDPAWASPTLDDRTWVEVDPYFAEIPRDWRGIGWLRQSIDVSPELVGHPLSLWIMALGTFEVYLDGVRLRALGDVDAARRGTRIAIARQPRDPTPIRFDRPGRHVLSLRFASARLRWTEQVGYPHPLQVYLAEPEKSARFAASIRHQVVFGPTLLVGGALVLTLLHLLLFFFYRSRPQNLHYAVVTAAMAGIAFGSTQATLADDVGSLAIFHVLFKDSVLLVAVALLRFYYGVFTDRVPPRYWVAASIAAAMAIGGYWLPLPIVYAFSALLMLESVRVLFTAFRRRKRGAGLIGVGGAFFAVGVLVQMLADVIPNMPQPELAYVYGFVALMVSMSAYLARDIAAQNAELSLLRDLEVAHRELQQTQAKLVQAEKMASLGQLVAGVAHEINTPVGAMASAQDSLARALTKLRLALSERDPHYDEARELARPLDVLDSAAEVIGSGSARVSEIVKRLRRFARLDEAEWQRADLRVGIEDTLMLLQHDLKHGVEVKRRFGDLPAIVCHPSQLNQVFLNLLVNAVQAMHGKGTIEIATRVDDGHVVVDIHDDGEGIAPEHLKRIFDPGFTTKGVGVGTGLGLSICYRIVQAHQGEIVVQSEPGVGSTFSVRLPVEPPAAATSAEPE